MSASKAHHVAIQLMFDNHIATIYAATVCLTVSSVDLDQREIRQIDRTATVHALGTALYGRNFNVFRYVAVPAGGAKRVCDGCLHVHAPGNGA